MKYINQNDYPLNYKQYEKDCISKCYEVKNADSDCRSDCDFYKNCGKHIYINNNPVIKININGSEFNPESPKPFLSCYMEALGKSQSIRRNGSVVFDTSSIDSVGNGISLDSSGTTFTIHRTGLYHIEWNLNLADSTTAAVFGILENGEPSSGSATVSGGNHSSGTIVNVSTVPFTLSLHNFTDAVSILDIDPYENSAASIRIVRFADGPSI